MRAVIEVREEVRAMSKHRFSRGAAGLVALVALVAAGCGGDSDRDVSTLANPASVYCVEQGGTLRIETGPDGGQYGMCHLPDGTEMEEWALYAQAQAGGSPSTVAPVTTVAPVVTTTPEHAETYDVFLLAPGDTCDAVVPMARTSTVEGTLGEALAVLLAGPTDDEVAAGFRSWFSPQTAGMLQSAVVEGGIAAVSFDGRLAAVIPNASSSCGSAGLLAQLDATTTQFPGIDRALYALDGSRAAFYEWVQMSVPSV